MTQTLDNFSFVLKQAALKWLHSIDFRDWSKTRGIADREYWSWKTKDFPNGTLQAGIAGFLDCSSLLELTDKQIQSVCKTVIVGTKSIQRFNGSFEEAYPFESSYAVTGLVLFNLMYSRLKYPRYFTPEMDKHLEGIAQGCLNFLNSTPETHGIISNHIATTELAIALANKWLNHTDDYNLTVFENQNIEGWFFEYSGADPGYETLLQSYFAMAQAAGLKIDNRLESLQKSRSFTQKFKLPNGSFAGEVGSRGTSIFYPGSILLCPNSNDNTWFFDYYLNFSGSVTPLTVDIGNFVPVFNSWAVLFSINHTLLPKSENIETTYKSIDYPNAGLYIRSTKDEVLLLSVKNCNWRHLKKVSASRWEDNSVASIYSNQKLLIGPASYIESSPQHLSFSPSLGDIPTQRLNNCFTSTLLRLLSFSFYLMPALQRLMKKFLAKYVMKAPLSEKQTDCKITFDISEEKINIHFKIPNASLKPYGYINHMASANSFETRAL